MYINWRLLNKAQQISQITNYYRNFYLIYNKLINDQFFIQLAICQNPIQNKRKSIGMLSEVFLLKQIIQTQLTQWFLTFSSYDVIMKWWNFSLLQALLEYFYRNGMGLTILIEQENLNQKKIIEIRCRIFTFVNPKKEKIKKVLTQYYTIYLKEKALNDKLLGESTKDNVNYYQLFDWRINQSVLFLQQLIKYL
ncbi:hypothetical protein pb186bvf_006147 [Paramecium bursaria]